MDRLVKIAYDIIEDFSADSPIESKEEKEKDVEVNTSKYVWMDGWMDECLSVCLSSLFLPNRFGKKSKINFFNFACINETLHDIFCLPFVYSVSVNYYHMICICLL